MWTDQATRMFEGSPLGVLALALAVSVLAAVFVGIVYGLTTRRTSGLRRFRYKRYPDGRLTRMVGPVKVEFQPDRGRWVLRTGRYVACDFVAERQTGREAPPDYRFETGDAALDGRFWFWSERPSFARLLLLDPDVRAALLKLPCLSIVLRGDELVIEVKRARVWMHDAVVRLAGAITRAG